MTDTVHDAAGEDAGAPAVPNPGSTSERRGSATATLEREVPRLKTKYRDEVKARLQAELGLGNVMLVHKGKPVRVGYEVRDGRKVRVAKVKGGKTEVIS